MTQEIFEISIEVDNEPQRTLFHYTSHASLIKIIESEKLFATGIRYLNDSSEFRYTEELFVKHIDSHFHIFDEKAKDWFLWLRKTLSAENELRGSAYVTCFTEEKDLLSQWRAYCRRKRLRNEGSAGANQSNAGGQPACDHPHLPWCGPRLPPRRRSAF